MLSLDDNCHSSPGTTVNGSCQRKMTMPNNNNKSSELVFDRHLSGYFQAHLVQLDETMTAIFKAVYEIYNFLATEKLDNILPHDLAIIKPVLDSIRNFHCPLNHNEDKTNARDSRWVTWIEFQTHYLSEDKRSHPWPTRWQN